MAAQQPFVELPTANFKGLIKNPSQLIVDRNAATLCSNVERSSGGQNTIRKGAKTNFHQQKVYKNQVLYPATYTYNDTTTGGTEEELIMLGLTMNDVYTQQVPSLYRLVEKDLVITYVGTGAGRLQLMPEFSDPTNSRRVQWRLVCTANGIVVYNSPFLTAEDSTILFGLGYLVAQINGLATFNCTPAALAAEDFESPIDVLGPFVDEAFTNGSTITLTYYSLELIGDTSFTAPLRFTDAKFVLPSFNNFENILDIAYGNYLHVYDGLDFYPAGLPQATITSVADAAAGATFGIGERYIYKIVFSRTDYRGNITEGTDSDDSLAVATHTMVANKNILLTFPTLANFGRWVSRSEKVTGAQVGVNTINVNAAYFGNPLLVGNLAYFIDRSTGLYVEREITAVGVGTITIGGTAVNVNNNDIISANIRAQIWRTKNGGTDFYLVEEVPVEGGAFSQTYTDSTPDSSLVEPFVPQIRKNDPPPKCQYVGSHQGLRVLAGDPSNPDALYWAKSDAPQGFPLASNSANIASGGTGGITGFSTIDPDGLVVFKLTGHTIVDGTLDDLNFRTLDKSNTGIGCTSFRTLCRIGESDAVIGLSLNGPFLFNGRTPQLAIGESISPIFDNRADPQVNGVAVPEDFQLSMLYLPDTVNNPLNFERAVAINDYNEQKYHLFIPSEMGTPAAFKVSCFPSCRYLVFDYKATNLMWVERTFYNRYREIVNGYGIQNVVPNSGFCIYQNKVWYGMHVIRRTGPPNDIRAVIGNFKTDDTIYAYSDDAYPVYLDLHYVPITREEGAATALFRPLWLLLYKFLGIDIADPALTDAQVDFGDSFSLSIRLVKDYKQYSGNTASTYVEKTFDPANARTVMKVKAVTTKARAIQIQLNNEGAEQFEIPAYDNLEFIYSTPYDRQPKEPKQ